MLVRAWYLSPQVAQTNNLSNSLNLFYLFTIIRLNISSANSSLYLSPITALSDLLVGVKG